MGCSCRTFREEPLARPWVFPSGALIPWSPRGFQRPRFVHGICSGGFSFNHPFSSMAHRSGRVINTDTLISPVLHVSIDG
jgi:hypothetical protein